jgi:hypothetical protein
MPQASRLKLQELQASSFTPQAYLIDANSVFTVVFSTKEGLTDLLLFTI